MILPDNTVTLQNLQPNMQSAANVQIFWTCAVTRSFPPHKRTSRLGLRWEKALLCLDPYPRDALFRGPAAFP